MILGIICGFVSWIYRPICIYFQNTTISIWNFWHLLLLFCLIRRSEMPFLDVFVDRPILGRVRAWIESKRNHLFGSCDRSTSFRGGWGILRLLMPLRFGFWIRNIWRESSSFILFLRIFCWRFGIPTRIGLQLWPFFRCWRWDRLFWGF